MCCDGRETPDCAAGGTSPPHVDVALPLLERRRREQRGHHPSRNRARISRAGEPCSRRRESADRASATDRRFRAADERAGIGRFRARTMNLSPGSTATVQISRNAFFASRFLTTMRTGVSGAGNRNDSENVRSAVCASSVVSHSPKIELKPRENSAVPVLASKTSKKYLPRLVSSSGREGFPGHGNGSRTTRSRTETLFFDVAGVVVVHAQRPRRRERRRRSQQAEHEDRHVGAGLQAGPASGRPQRPSPTSICRARRRTSR